MIQKNFTGLRRREAQQAKKLESLKNSPPQSPRENRLPSMGEQSQERKIGELCTPDIINLPILNLAEIGRPFEIKTSTICMVQHSPFTGKEDPNLHLQTFIELCQTFNIDAVPQDQMRAMLFPFSLLGKALQCFHSQPAETVQNWNALKSAFVKAIQTCSGKQTEDSERSAGARKPKPSAEAEEFAKEEVTEIVTEEPEFEMPGEDTKIPQLKPRYFRGKLDNHFEKFVEVVRRLSIDKPLLDALQVPTYSRYFKDILANKYEIATLGVDHVKMSEQCSAAIANGLEKQKDTGCPTIPCSVGSFKFEKALCDLGASVSIMPRDVLEKLRLPLEPTGMCLELGDNSIRYPLGIAEDVPVKVGHHFIPVDFVVLEMGEREKPPLILGRPLLKTVGATIDVSKGEIMFNINGERSSFKFRPCLEVCNMI
jgi:hypothetical protein